MKIHFITILIVVGIIEISCNTRKTEMDKPTGLIEITKLQFELEKMEFGEPKLMPFSELIHFTGIIAPSEKGITNISLAISGVIQKIDCKVGEQVKKNQILFQISGNEFIDMQRDFSESSALLMRLRSEYERSKELFNENVGTQKDFILAESLYKIEVAKYMALKIKLEQIGLDVSRIEKGEFYSSYSLKSPNNGFISSINICMGQNIQANSVLAEIIDVQLFQLKLAIFESDINKIKVGQDIKFYFGENKKIAQKAKLKIIGKTINTNSKAIDCYAEIENLSELNLVNNQFIEGEIIAGSDSAYSLPKTSIIKSENDNYILKLENETDKSYFFSKIKINIGNVNKEYVELIDFPKMNKLLINGTYNVKID